MQVLAATPIPKTAVLAMSLFTNDDPSHTSNLRQAVSESLRRVGPRGCVIWATIARPPLNGVTYGAANAVLQTMAEGDSRLRIVPWAEQVTAYPQLLAGDGVHATQSGYALRSQLYMQAATSCG